MRVLGDADEFHGHGLPDDALHYGGCIREGEGDGGLRDDNALTVAEKDFHRDAGIVLPFVGEVH